MDLALDNVAKLYSDHWVFRKVNCSISKGQKWAILGHNGSGKSTLLSMMMGLTLPTEGKVSYTLDSRTIDTDLATSLMSFCAPYMSVPQELTGPELIDYFSSFRSLVQDHDATSVMNLASLWQDRAKTISQYSTGMTQRLKLALAFSIESQIVLLDEPTSNLDEKSKEWYQSLIKDHLKDRTLIVATNDAFDHRACEHSLKISEFKPE